MASFSKTGFATILIGFASLCQFACFARVVEAAIAARQVDVTSATHGETLVNQVLTPDGRVLDLSSVGEANLASLGFSQHNDSSRIQSLASQTAGGGSGGQNGGNNRPGAPSQKGTQPNLDDGSVIEKIAPSQNGPYASDENENNGDDSEYGDDDISEVVWDSLEDDDEDLPISGPNIPGPSDPNPNNLGGWTPGDTNQGGPNDDVVTNVVDDIQDSVGLGDEIPSFLDDPANEDLVVVAASSDPVSAYPPPPATDVAPEPSQIIIWLALASFCYPARRLFV